MEVSILTECDGTLVIGKRRKAGGMVVDGIRILIQSPFPFKFLNHSYLFGHSVHLIFSVLVIFVLDIKLACFFFAFFVGRGVSYQITSFPK